MPVRLILSDDEWLADERVRAIVEPLVRDGAELVHVDAEAGGVSGLDEALFAQSLFAAERVVVVRGSERLQAAGIKRLAESSSRSDAAVEVVVVAVADRQPAALVRALQGAGSVERLARPKRGELVAWVARRIRDAGAVPDKDVAGLLIETIGTSLRDLAQAAAQLSMRVGRGGAVGASDIRAAFHGAAEQPAWALYDALLARDGHRAYRVLHTLFASGHDPIGILFAIVSSNRHLMRARSVIERSSRVSEGELASALAVSPARAGVLRRQASQASWAWMVRLHHSCAAADFDLKGGDEVRIVGLLPPEIILERLIDHALPAMDLVRG